MTSPDIASVTATAASTRTRYRTEGRAQLHATEAARRPCRLPGAACPLEDDARAVGLFSGGVWWVSGGV
jgi:hypothetical protein